MWFNVNYNKLVVLNQPTFLRKNVMVAFLRSLIYPISKLYYEWFVYRKSNLYKLAHNGQVCYLRKVLNDRFDPSLRRITIGNGQKYDKNFIYTNVEQKPEFLGKIYLRQRSDYTDTGVDFVVYVPLELLNINSSSRTTNTVETNRNYELKALINYYKEGAKRYKIEAI